MQYTERIGWRAPLVGHAKGFLPFAARLARTAGVTGFLSFIRAPHECGVVTTRRDLPQYLNKKKRV